MEVDATHTRNEFMCWMHGKCFGCRSAVYSKKDGNHNHDLLRVDGLYCVAVIPG